MAESSMSPLSIPRGDAHSILGISNPGCEKKKKKGQENYIVLKTPSSLLSGIILNCYQKIKNIFLFLHRNDMIA